MAYRRVIYLIALVGCLVFYWAYREWMSWLLLMAVVGLPWLSLAVSLPALIRGKWALHCPEAVERGQEAQARFGVECALPAPPVAGTLTFRHSLTGKRTRGTRLPTEHCGRVTVELKRGWKYDYLGLFRLPVGRKERASVFVRPKSVAISPVPDLSRYLAQAFRPKPGGGYAENHELRLYRPGDNLHQIHWKLSAKTGKLILREPMEALRGLALVTLELSGTPEVLDDKLGRLLWLSRYLVEQQVPHQIHCLTERGMEQFSVRCEADVLTALDAIVSSGPVPEASPEYIASAWRFHIGGEPDEG